MVERSAGRHVVVAPGMCSGGSLIFGTIGDWTWEAVAAACKLNVFNARNSVGNPAYLSFYYYRVRGGGVVHPHGLSFGDELQVSSRVFGLGVSSVLTLHRLAPAWLDVAETPFEPTEFYDAPHPDCMYVENLNRWVSRSESDSNRHLYEAAPMEFSNSQLPKIPNQYSPRSALGHAREYGSFYASDAPNLTAVGGTFTTTYQLNIVRDFNGAGLLYFASYFSIFDGALLELWRSMGRSDRQFLERKLLDQRVGFFGNADSRTEVRISIRLWRDIRRPAVELADMAMHDLKTGRLLAVSATDLAIIG
ncbi:LnmK family bifunctional acyltransferase/decarboxylase [Micromonospora sp. NPDC005172]|uniref:LnmK family bifunctional acyltransferase/decarboxylase n=1 Tax=Micromonospora sp. NPDC005172 TaxID=3156867 RepID=UPI0033B19C76